VKVFFGVVVLAVAAGAYYVYRNPTVVSPLVEDTPLEGVVRKTLGTTRLYGVPKRRKCGTFAAKENY
jgi:hypothetical protein